MADDRWAMYNILIDKGAHSAEWFENANDLLKLAFAGDRCKAKRPCNRCWNRRILFEYEMSDHIAKQGFMPNYLVWHQHGEVQAPTADESDENDDEDWMDDMMANIGLEKSIHCRRCRISTGSLLSETKKCMMATICPYCRR
jgi:hypothetical protein